MRRCAVAKCSSTDKNSKAHRFPTKRELAQKWQANLQLDHIDLEHLWRNHVVCNRHFKLSDYRNRNLQSRLNFTAIPHLSCGESHPHARDELVHIDGMEKQQISPKDRLQFDNQIDHDCDGYQHSEKEYENYNSIEFLQDAYVEETNCDDIGDSDVFFVEVVDDLVSHDTTGTNEVFDKHPVEILDKDEEHHTTEVLHLHECGVLDDDDDRGADYEVLEEVTENDTPAPDCFNHLSRIQLAEELMAAKEKIAELENTIKNYHMAHSRMLNHMDAFKKLVKNT